MGGRPAWVCVMVALGGCTAINPAYENIDSSAGGSGSASMPDGYPDTGSSMATGSWLWISNPVTGDWFARDSDPCGSVPTQAAAVCANAPIPLVGRSTRPLETLPEQWAFLLDGPFHAAASGELVLVAFEDLLDGEVENTFVEGLTSPDPQAELYVWRGPIDEVASPECSDWSSPAPLGSIAFFEAGSASVGLGTAPCASQMALLCACAAAD